MGDSWLGSTCRLFGSQAGHGERHEPRLLRSSAVFSAMTLLSRIAGWSATMVFSRACSAPAPAMDAFVVAFRIPNFLRRIFAEGSFSMAFVPVLTELQGDAATRRR